MRVMYSTGMRPGEAGKFKWCDISSEDLSIFIRTGKGDKDRYVCMDEETLQQLLSFRGQQPLEAKVFNISSVSIWKAVRKYSDSTGLTERYNALGRRVSARMLRHAYATHCYENGMDLDTMQLLLGHTFLETTRVYVEMGLRGVRKQYDKAHELSRK
jgi:site-specific recombinase XerD